MTAPAGTRSKHTVVLALGTAQTLAWASTYYLPAVLADPVSAEIGLPREWFFGIFSAALLLSDLLGPAAGRAIDRHGGCDVLALSNLVFAAGLLLLATSTGLAGLSVAWFVLGVAWRVASTTPRLPPWPGSTVPRRGARSPGSHCWPASPALSGGQSRRC